jgi:hypothetical protein
MLITRHCIIGSVRFGDDRQRQYCRRKAKVTDPIKGGRHEILSG